MDFSLAGNSPGAATFKRIGRASRKMSGTSTTTSLKNLDSILISIAPYDFAKHRKKTGIQQDSMDQTNQCRSLWQFVGTPRRDLAQDFRGISGHNCVRGHVFRYHAPGAHNSVLSDRDIRQNR